MKNFKFTFLFLGVFIILPNIIKAETPVTFFEKPSITVTYPNGDEVFNAGDKISIKWTSVGIPENTKVVVFLEGQENKDRIYATSLSRGEIINDGEETLSLIDFVGTEFSNASWGAGKHYKISVSTVYPMIKDYSDNFFTINASTTKQINNNVKEEKNNIMQQKKPEISVFIKESNKKLVKENKDNLSTEKVSIQKEEMPTKNSDSLSVISTNKPNLWQRLIRLFLGSRKNKFINLL